jgi:hypothetical protein
MQFTATVEVRNVRCNMIVYFKEMNYVIKCHILLRG